VIPRKGVESRQAQSFVLDKPLQIVIPRKGVESGHGRGEDQQAEALQVIPRKGVESILALVHRDPHIADSDPERGS
jgi:hypothetical protein